MTITLAKTETKLLLEAAGSGGVLVFPEGVKPVTRARLLGKLEAEGLMAADGADARLTPAGYRAIGLRPPRRPARAAVAVVAERPAGEAAEVGAAATGVAAAGRAPGASPGTKRALIAALLGREDGASLDELIAATGWLPHTTRAALSRIRSAGETLAKSTRPDGKTAYRLGVAPIAAAPETGVRRTRGRKAGDAAPAVAA